MASMHALSLKWPVVLTLAVLTGCLPFTFSGVLEFCAIVALPFCLGFLICRWWTGSLTRLALAIALSALGSSVRLFSSSLHDGANWFGRLFRAVGAVGISDPYVRQILLTLLFPVLVCTVATVMFMSFQRRAHVADA